MNLRAIAVAMLVACLGLSNAAAQDWQRGVRNYQAVMSGAKKIEQLSPQEQQEVIAVYRRVKATEDGGKPACRDAN